MTHLRLGAGGEFDLIRAMAARWGNRATGLGDDAAVLDVPPGERLVVSTDAAVEHVHFERAWFAAEEIGWRAMAGAASDLAAMGARPLGAVIALTLPESWRGDAMALAEGLGACAARCGLPIVGGDTTRGDRLSLAITVLGSAARPLARSGARPGDAVWVTGALGGPGAAWRALAAGAAPEPAHRERFARPVPRLAAAQWAAAHGARAAIDLSDGLAQDLGHVAAASGVGIVVSLGAVPCVVGVAPQAALASGEEYEVALVAPPDFDAAGCAAAGGVPLTRIGEVTGGPPGVTVRDAAGNVVEVPRGYDHFSGL